ncbi:hypothetical protein AURDEDRAFT_122705 [Auricularia subglabra TFB-10046 SS5]|nr:hypothetical protein AURDEDRAFT_122705 [Auricularia subglabra TFB-10046 SS5]
MSALPPFNAAQAPWNYTPDEIAAVAAQYISQFGAPMASGGAFGWQMQEPPQLPPAYEQHPIGDFDIFAAMNPEAMAQQPAFPAFTQHNTAPAAWAPAPYFALPVTHAAHGPIVLPSLGVAIPRLTEEIAIPLVAEETAIAQEQDAEMSSPPASPVSPEPRRTRRKKLTVSGSSKKANVAATPTGRPSWHKMLLKKERVSFEAAQRMYEQSVANDPDNTACPFASCGWVSGGLRYVRAHKRHVLSHALLKGFPCPWCNSLKSRHDSLVTHMRVCPERPEDA